MQTHRGGAYPAASAKIEIQLLFLEKAGTEQKRQLYSGLSLAKRPAEPFGSLIFQTALAAFFVSFPHNDPTFDCVFQTYDTPFTDADSVPIEVSRGSVMFFNGYTLHRSLPNYRTTGFRLALAYHYMSAESFLPWYQKPEVSNAKSNYRDIILVAGVDPYAWKGLEDTAKPIVHKSGRGWLRRRSPLVR